MMHFLTQKQCFFFMMGVSFYRMDFAIGTSLMKRIRERQNENNPLNRDTENWMHVPLSIQDVLISIDDKLRGLDTFSHTLKLARLDFSLDQLVRRMENVESKLGRLETKFDLRMEKVEEIVVSKDIKEEFSNEHLSRKLETLNDKINNKAAYLDAKLDIKLERIMSKLELLERDLHNSVDDVLERLVKGEEKCRFAEIEITKQEKKLEIIVADMHEIKAFVKGDLANTVAQNFASLSSEVNSVKTFMQVKENTSEKAWTDIQTSMSGTRERLLLLLQDSSNKIDNLSATFNQGDRSRSAPVLDLCGTSEQIENLTSKLEKALTIGETKFKELDADVEQYTKKVINGIQELWKTSDELKVDLSQTLEQGSKTREMVRREFQRLHEQIEPKLEPKLSDIDKRVVELSATVDNSFATLLVAQNTFIDSCKRIQQEELHVYDILQQIVYEMRNRSVSDIHRISSEFQQQSFQINKSISHVLAAVWMTGNMTTSILNDLVKKGEESINWNKLCVVGDVVKNYSTQVQEDSMYESVNDSNLNLNEYEDYQLSR
nr:uncharacterized protein LOC122270628 [Parasteatoda tepidariorum]